MDMAFSLGRDRMQRAPILQLRTCYTDGRSRCCCCCCCCCAISPASDAWAAAAKHENTIKDQQTDDGFIKFISPTSSDDYIIAPGRRYPSSIHDSTDVN